MGGKTSSATSAPVKTSARGANKKERREKQPPKLHPHIAPDDMPLKHWQIMLRRQFAANQPFQMTNVGGREVLSDYEVTNPATKRSYRVAIRGRLPGDNFCSCPDFATNELGTCKHVEFVLHRLHQQPGADEAFARGYEGPYSSVYLRYGAQRTVRFRPAPTCPPKLLNLANDYFDARRVLKPDAFARFDEFISQTAGLEHDLRLYPDALEFIASVNDARRREEIIDTAFPRGIDSPAFNKLLKVPLYPYQRQGALFAARAGRCLIGDEMGLGKTVQAIAAAEIMAGHLGVRKVLVVCPTSLKHQWKLEVEKFSNRTAQVITGLRPGRESGYAAESFYKITNYDVIRRDLDLIDNWSPDLVILDEAQRIKNWNTLAARAVKQLKSTYAIVLTGTPLENRLEELLSVVQFIDMYRFGPTYQFLHRHQLRDDQTGRVLGYQHLDAIGRTLAPLLLRRKKDTVLKELPERIDKTFFVPMTPEQARLHEENRELVARIASKWRQTQFLTEIERRKLMIGLQNMRMSCDSTWLVDHATDFGSKADELLTLLDECLETPGQKVVIFSQWLRMHELIERRLGKRPWKYVLFHGGVPGDQRGAQVSRFRDDPDCRLFLSTDAGGVGLNLQHAASIVVNMDLPWNPAVLEQRIGRVHRMGQRHPVRVVNFVSRGTIEEGMLSVLKFKKSLFAGALDGEMTSVMRSKSNLKQMIETFEKVTANTDLQRDHLEPSDAAVSSPEPPHAADSSDPATSSDSSTQGAPAKSSVDEGDAALPEPDDDAGSVNHGSIPAHDHHQKLEALLQVGLNLLQQLAGQGRQDRPADAPGLRSTPASVPTPRIERDAATGESYMRIPIKPDSLDRALKALSSILGP